MKKDIYIKVTVDDNKMPVYNAIEIVKAHLGNLVGDEIIDSYAVQENIKTMPAFPPKSNPFHHDQYRMGCQLGINVTAMYERHANEYQPYVIIVNTDTGERTRMVFNSEIFTLG